MNRECALRMGGMAIVLLLGLGSLALGPLAVGILGVTVGFWALLPA